MVNGARLIGPSIAGLLVASFGEGICFLLNTFSYLAVIVAISMMRMPQSSKYRLPRRNILQELNEGILYAYKFGPIRSILLLIALVSLMGMPYSVLVPVFAKDILHGGVHTFGFLMTAAGSGALVGTLLLASRKSVLGLGHVIVTATILFSSGIVMFALSSNFILSMAAMTLAGFGAMTLVASCNTVLQTILDEDKRGRVMSFFTVAFMGVAPFGSLGAGSMAGIIGPRNTLLLGSIGCLVGAMVFARHLPQIREKVRPIYELMGIIKKADDEEEIGLKKPPLN